MTMVARVAQPAEVAVIPNSSFPEHRNLGRLRYIFRKRVQVGLWRVRKNDNGGESSATCRGCGDSELVFSGAAQPRQVALHIRRSESDGTVCLLRYRLSRDRNCDQRSKIQWQQ